jgi:hydroxyethylthiazole kinase-like uncharacterized protein yjeF
MALVDSPHPSDSPHSDGSLLRTASIRAIEARALAATEPGELMARAARAVADAAERYARGLVAGTPVFVFCGPGNNGGDALLAALMLQERGYDVRAFELADAAPGKKVPTDAARVRARAASVGQAPTRIESSQALCELFSACLQRKAPAPLVLDGLFGIGLTRPLAGLAGELCRLLASVGATVIAIDVPSGLDADTGAVVGGADGAAIRATATITMIADKPGLHTGAALDHVGEARLASLGTNAAGRADGRLFGFADAAALLPTRPQDSSKGSFGSVLVIGGATGMSGAALLAARSAQSCGAGKVWIAAPGSPVFDPGQPQLMTRNADAPFDGATVLVVGCGLGTEGRSAALLGRALASLLPAVIDADALNMLADGSVRWTVPAAASRVLTPHPLEAARLAGCKVAAIQADRIGQACSLAAARGAIVVLKGAGTVVASPDGRWSIIDSGGPALATAGTGDVLAGLIGGLIAQGLEPHDAALLGCWAHGNAADRWTAARGRGAGLSAAELPALIRDALSALAPGSHIYDSEIRAAQAPDHE